MNESTRRSLIKKTAVSLGSLAFVSKAALAGANSCELTPAQTEGPFYPVNDQMDKDADLTYMSDRTQTALGDVIIIKGKVMDDNCKPVEKAIVEIWQACASGKYNHPGDPNPAKLDPNFQYWGRAFTNKKGEYSFKTIRPGQYDATSTWTRPAHIHFKVHRRGFSELTSQLYFASDEYNDSDRILQSLSTADQEKLVVEFKHPVGPLGVMNKRPKVGLFDITITGIN
jgi:protocatechuate 3,4-dioxygenase beta subunit